MRLCLNRFYLATLLSNEQQPHAETGVGEITAGKTGLELNRCLTLLSHNTRSSRVQNIAERLFGSLRGSRDDRCFNYEQFSEDQIG
jgi:hypothetical protein